MDRKAVAEHLRNWAQKDIPVAEKVSRGLWTIGFILLATSLGLLCKEQDMINTATSLMDEAMKQGANGLPQPELGQLAREAVINAFELEEPRKLVTGCALITGGGAFMAHLLGQYNDFTRKHTTKNSTHIIPWLADKLDPASAVSTQQS